MTKVTGSLWDVSKAATRATEVRVHAKEARTSGDGLITTEQARVDINAGRVTFDCEPGWALMWIMGGGRVHEEIPLFVPGEAASLAECVQMGADIGEYAPETLANFAAEVRQSLSDAEGVLGRVSGQAKAAESSASAAAGSESRAKGHADTAKTLAESAGKSATDAGTYATSARNYAVTSTGQADKATGAAASAKADADRVATIAGSTRWVGTKVEVNGKLSPDLKGEKGAPGRDGSTRFEDLTPAQRDSLVGARGPAGVVASTTDPGKDVVWLDTQGQVGGLSEPTVMTASGSGWQYATKPGGSSRYVVDYRGWAVLTVTATDCDEVRLYDFSQATNPFAVGAAPAGNIKGAFLTTQAVVNCAPGGPAVRVLNPTAETKIWLSVEPLEARGQVVWVPDGKGGRESFTALSGPPGKQGPPGPPGTTAWSGITGKPATYPTTWSEVLGKPDTFPAATHSHTVSDLSDISDGVRNTLKNGNTSTTASSAGAVAWGRGAKATSTDAVALGYNTQSSGTDSAALGSYSKVKQNQHVVVGVDATDEGVAQQRGTVIIGKTGAPVIISGRDVVTELDSLGEQVAARAAKSDLTDFATKNEVERRPAFFWGFGPPPTEIPDAVVGDVYCNLSTGELHEITGV